MIQRLKEMGFPEDQCAEALRRSNNDYEAACAWLLGDAEVHFLFLYT